MSSNKIDWNILWLEAQQRRSWHRTGRSTWDRRATSFAEKNINSAYAREFLRRMAPEQSWSVLDIGCGPGTLALPLARLVRQITAVDYSPAMLAILQKKAAEENIQNIQTVESSWDDDWDKAGIGSYDAVIASRALSNVKDLQEALLKLNNRAKKMVFLADRVGDGPLDAGAFAAVGRDFSPGPDYIYTVNLLYQLGIHAGVDFITLEADTTYNSWEKALASLTWMFDNLTAAEERKLAAYAESKTTRTSTGGWRLTGEGRTKWAFINWNKPTPHKNSSTHGA